MITRELGGGGKGAYTVYGKLHPGSLDCNLFWNKLVALVHMEHKDLWKTPTAEISPEGTDHAAPNLIVEKCLLKQ